MTDFEEKLLVARSMIRFGGGFVRSLGEALQRADQHDSYRICAAFPEYWKDYLQKAKDNGLDKEEE